VQGSLQSPDALQEVEERNKIKYTPEQIQTYTNMGGMPSLDMNYTVFGEVLEGMEVVDKIAAVPVNTHDWPSQEIYITMEVVE
jgi:peptidyl-prolyl cis-trans isomerase B (cyclophilin B)